MIETRIINKLLRNFIVVERRKEIILQRKLRLKKIISGGQTGVDRAAFDFALENGVEIGGHVPKGRRAEDGKISEKYPNLIETATRNYTERTELNVQTSDATLILSYSKLTGGSKLTRKFAGKHAKPFLHINFSDLTIENLVDKTQKWLALIKHENLNIAGPRASTDDRVYEMTKIFLKKVFGFNV